MELTRTDGSPLRVLVVDDEANIAELISMALRYEGFDVRSAHTGTKAVSAAMAAQSAASPSAGPLSSKRRSIAMTFGSSRAIASTILAISARGSG